MSSFNTCKGPNYLLKDWHYVNVTFAGPLNPVIKLLSKLFCNMNVAYKKKSCKRNGCDIFWVCSISIMSVWDEGFVRTAQNLNEIRRRRGEDVMWGKVTLQRGKFILGFPQEFVSRRSMAQLRGEFNPQIKTCHWRDTSPTFLWGCVGWSVAGNLFSLSTVRVTHL